MSYVIPAGFSRLTFQYAPASPLGSAVVWGLGLESPPSAAILAEIEEWYTSTYQIICCEAYTLERIEMRSDTLVEERVVSYKGDTTTPHPPPQVAALVSLTTGLPGRTNRGRIYWPGVVPEASSDANGIIEPTKLAQLQNIWDAFAGFLDGLSAAPVILHSGSSDPTPVTNGVVRQSVATQRRRQRA